MSSDSEESTFAVREDGRQGKLEVLGMHLGGEAVADRLLGPGGDLDTITGGSQVAGDLGLILGVTKSTANKIDGNRVRLIVGDGDQRLGRVAIDKLNAKNLRGWEGSLRRNGKNRGLCFSLFSILNRSHESVNWALRQR